MYRTSHFIRTAKLNDLVASIIAVGRVAFVKGPSLPSQIMLGSC